MSVKKRVLILILLVTLVMPMGVGWAHSAATDYQIPWDVYASGGGRMSSDNYSMNGTAGQPTVGSTSGDNGKIGAGFWTVFAETIFEIFLPLVVR